MKPLEKIDRYYKKSIYTKSHLRAFVEKNIITIEEYEEITGEEYNNLDK